MDILTVRSLIRNRLYYPDSMLTDDMLDAAIQEALRKLTSWTSGCIVQGYKDDILVKYPRAIILRKYYTDGIIPYSGAEDPTTLIDVSNWQGYEGGGGWLVVLVDWDLNNIEQDKWMLERFLTLVTAIANKYLAKKFYLSNAVEGLPFDLKSEDVISKSDEEIEKIKQDILENYIVPAI